MAATAARSEAKTEHREPDTAHGTSRAASSRALRSDDHALSPTMDPQSAAALIAEQAGGESSAARRRAMLVRIQQTYGNRYAASVVAELRARGTVETGKMPSDPLVAESAASSRAPAAAPAVGGTQGAAQATKPTAGAAPATKPMAEAAARPAAAAPDGRAPAAAAQANAGTADVMKPGTKASSAAAQSAAATSAPSASPTSAAAPAAAVGPAAASVAAAPVAKAEGSAAASAAGPKAAAPSPHEAIASTIADIHHRAAHSGAHTPAAAAVGSAQAAAITPKTEQLRSAATQTVGNLGAATAQTKSVPRDEFRAKLKKAIEDATPKPATEAAADRLMKSGAADARATMGGQLATQRDTATGPLKAQSQPGADVPAASQPAPPQAVLQPEQTGAPPAPVSAASVAPAPLPAERLDYSSDREPTDRAMAENKVSKEQLAKGNEPAFGQTLQARASVEQHEAGTEARYRQSEAKVQDHAKLAAQAELAKGLGSIHGARQQHVGRVAGHQVGTAAKNAGERQRITETINGIRDKTRSQVTEILSTMEKEAAGIFEAGLSRAEQAYKDTFEDAKGGVGTWLTTWGSDWEKLIEESLGKARVRYLQEVDVAVDQVVTLVDTKLAAAKACVAGGRKQVDDFRNSLDSSVQHFADGAMAVVSADFDAMGEEINQRRDALVDKLAQQYKSSSERMSAMEQELREANKSLWQRIYDATIGLIEKIIAFKNMLLGLLAKAAAVLDDIISDPIGFLGNLVSGVMLGLKNFMSNIGKHLKKGLMEWIFGALAGAGLQLPDSFDLKGIVSIVLQVLGLTYANFRSRAVAIVGEPIVAALEQAAEIFKIVATEGISGLWRFIKEKVEDLKSMVLDAIFDFIKERVLIAGVTWIIGLLNPASAFFKACKAIYDIVMFFVTRGQQILDLVNAVIDSIAAIAKGSIGVAATMVETALAKAIPVAIGFLAGLLGLGDISGTIRKTIEKAQAPVNKAIDWVIGKAVALVKAAGGFIKGLFGGKQEGKKSEETSETKDPVHDAKVAAGLEAVDAAEHEVAPDGRPTREQAEGVLQKVRREHPVFTAGTVADGGEFWIYELTASKHTKKGHGIHPDCARMIKRLRGISGVGVEKLITVLERNLTDGQRVGYLFQAERTIFWYNQGVLKQVELEFRFASGGRVEVSQFDIVIEQEDVEGKENASKTWIYIDTKSWREATRLGQMVMNTSLPKTVRDDARLELQRWVDRAAKRLNKYRRLGLNVLVEWKGPIPEEIALLRKPASAIVYGSIDFSEIP